MPRNFFFASLFFFLLPGLSAAQKADEDAFFIKRIYDSALSQGQAYDWLSYLSTHIGARLGGSPQAAAAVEYTRQLLDTLGLDTVWLQPCTTPHWVRGAPEQVRIVNSPKRGSIDLRALALGNSVATSPQGLTAEVVEVRSLDAVDSLGQAGIAGKIVFFNRPMDPTQIQTFNAYGGAVDQRGAGPSRASRYGAVGVLVRSMTNRIDGVPHTGGTRYDDDVVPIPAIAISTQDAELLSSLLREEPVRVFMQSNCRMLSPKQSYNVIGEIRGSERPDDIILVGGHLDSWDVGQGAHDDGAGCVQAMEVLRLMRLLGYRPKRTIRCVLFMNEENGLAGGRAYWAASNSKKEYHLAAIESDAGGFTPRGFSCEALPEVFNQKFKHVSAWLPLLEPYGIMLEKGGSGADISGLKGQGGLLCGLRPDSQRYFDYHHTTADVLDTVNPRELALGAGGMLAFVYLLDKYGTE